MVKHIVMWKFKPDTEEQQELFVSKLRGLMGVIPELRSCEVAANCRPGNWDAVLISEFDSYEALETYKNDPRHVAVSDLCKSIRIERAAVDYEF